VNDVPQQTLLFEAYKSKQIAYATACQSAWRWAVQLQEDGYEIKLLQKEVK